MNHLKIETRNYKNQIEKIITKFYKASLQLIRKQHKRRSQNHKRQIKTRQKNKKLPKVESLIKLKSILLKKPACRIINHTKNNFEKISTQIVEKIFTKLRIILSINQWKNKKKKHLICLTTSQIKI